MIVPLRIVADENIPRVDEAFATLGTVHAKPGAEIGPDDVQAADVLLVRSVTPVEEGLLAGHTLEFVGSATAGTDHVDQAVLADRGIAFAHAPGSNATSVADYVVAALLTLAFRTGRSLEGRTIGIVGCGAIGGRLARRLPALGLSVLKNDPPLADAAEERGEPHDFRSLDTMLDEADVLTLHVPLTTDAPYPTRHLIGETVLRRLGGDAWLVNASRGAVVDGEALRGALETGRLGAAVLDVWENEPTPNPALVRAVDGATPHIAGYAYDGKVRGTMMLYRALCRHLDVEPSWTPEEALRPDAPDALRCAPPDPRLPRTTWLHRLARQAYDLRVDDRRLRNGLARPPDEWGNHFQRLRKTYRCRREFQRYGVPRHAIPDTCRRAVEEGLTMQPVGRG